jgi:hypothetical protein
MQERSFNHMFICGKVNAFPTFAIEFVVRIVTIVERLSVIG